MLECKKQRFNSALILMNMPMNEHNVFQKIIM
jgi:hypothetical protein